jgi:uncharacterized protein (DUF2236 family)
MDVARRVVGERLIVLGWGRAILMQIAHPAVAAAIDEHSAFREGPLAPFRRLHRTVRAMREMILGSEPRARRAAARIREVHDRVNGRLRGGAPYSAHDPALLLWVHATLVDSFLLVYETLVGPLASRDRDRVCVEAAKANARIGLPEAACPRDTAALAAYFEALRASGALAVGETAKRLAAAILRPPFAWVARPLASLHRDLSVGTLPPWLRETYGFAWGAADERRLREATDRVRRIRAHAPEALARWPEARVPGEGARQSARSSRSTSDPAAASTVAS